MPEIGVYVFAFLALLCGLLALFSIFKFSRYSEVTPKAIRISALFGYGLLIFGALAMLASGADALSVLCFLAISLIGVSIYWIVSLLNLKLSRRGPMRTLEEFADFIRRK